MGSRAKADIADPIATGRLELCHSCLEAAAQYFGFEGRVRPLPGASAAAVAGELLHQIDELADLLTAMPIVRGQYLKFVVDEIGQAAVDQDTKLMSIRIEFGAP